MEKGQNLKPIQDIRIKTDMTNQGKATTKSSPVTTSQS